MSGKVRELTPADAAALATLYEDYDWWEDRDEDKVATAIRNTDLALGYEEDEALVASARVLTDGAYYARIYDVIVAADHRGEGVGEELVRAVLDHPTLADVATVTLSCREGLVEFYERCGFERHDGEYEHESGTESACTMVVTDRD